MPLKPCLLILILALLFCACGPARDPSLDEMAATLRSRTPPEARTVLDADLAALATLSREQKLGTAEREAMVDLFRSATRDGTLDDDGRALLVHLVRDVVSGGGSLKAESKAPRGAP